MNAPPDEVTTSRVGGVYREAWISPDGRYRYHLTRSWDDLVDPLTFVMLNPSTADAFVDDRTIGRCCQFARREGFGGVTVVNLYALRSTRPVHLWEADDPVGPSNDEVLLEALDTAVERGRPVVAAWGVNAKPDRVAWLLDQPGAEHLHHLGLTKAGAPMHPLYRPGDTPLTPWLR